MPLLELTDVHARYGQVAAVHGVSLTVDEGEIVALLGANGAGKTTTLRAISGMVATDGTSSSTASRCRAGRGHGAAGHHARPRGPRHPRRADGLGEPARWARTCAATARRCARPRRGDERLPWLRDRRDQQAGTLSGGEQQMLALARARLSRPRLLLLDEPSLGLAPLIVEQFFALVRRLNEEHGAHRARRRAERERALELSSRAYLLEVGRVALEGASAELREHEGVRKSYLGY